MNKSILRKMIFALIAMFAVVVGAYGVHLVSGTTLFAASNDSDITATVLDSNSRYLDAQYIDIHSLSSEQITNYSNSGGSKESNPLSYAFDRNWSTFWKSDQANNVNDFHNVLQIDFDASYTIDRILYQAENYSDGRGYPNEFIVYAKQGTEYVKVGTCKSKPTVKMVMFTLPNAVDTDSIKIEFVDVNRAHSWNIEAYEIIILSPETNDTRDIMNLFSDYAMYHVNSNYRTVQDIVNLETRLASNPHFEQMQELTTRAKSILGNEICFDYRREFGTDTNSVNVLSRHGAVKDYANRTLKMVWMSTDRQSTGIYAKPGEEITVYVTAEDDDPLPRLYFSQHWGTWRGWLGSVALNRGKNVFKALDYYTNFTQFFDDTSVMPGGPIYLANPYTPDDQSSNVKVYIEGGHLFPQYKLGQNEGRYLAELHEYVEDMNANPNEIMNVTELVSDRFIFTVRASVADEVYNNPNSDASPSKNFDYWDPYLKKVLEFEGISFDPNDPHYDERANYINCNIRLMQKFGWAYAYPEHVGIQVDWEGAALYATTSVGWGFTHELGHMIDISERTVSECSNNMMSQYIEVAVDKNTPRGSFANIRQYLIPDGSDVNLWNKDASNFLVWWLIECHWPGYWGKVENMYRYENFDIKPLGMTGTEKQIYFTSLVTGVDMSYYFDRWGYALENHTEGEGKEAHAVYESFTIEGASEAFKEKMNEAVAAGKISRTVAPKLWYFDENQYWIQTSGQNLNCYTGSIQPKILSAYKSSAGNTIEISSPVSNNPAHLGYEVIEGTGADKHVIGFTNSDYFVDTNTYASNYTPIYSVVGYDRNLNTSKASLGVALGTTDAVCRLGDVTYPSLGAAIAAASDNSTIYLLKNVADVNVVVDKNITITPVDTLRGVVTISKITGKDLFIVNDNITLSILGTDKCRVEIRSAKSVKEGALINVLGSCKLDYCNVMDNYTTSNTLGGAIFIRNAGRRFVQLEATNTKFSGNYAYSGSAIFANNSSNTTINLTNCEFTNNSSKVDGGALVNRGTVNMTACTFRDNTSGSTGGAICNTDGGVMYLVDCVIENNTSKYGGGLFLNGYVDLSSCKLSGNVGDFGGSIYLNAANDSRAATLFEGTEVLANSNDDTVAIYINRGVMNLRGCKVETRGTSYGIYAASGKLNIYGAHNFNKTAYAATILDTSMYINTDEENNAASIKILTSMPDIRKLEISVDAIEDEKAIILTDFDITESDISRMSAKYATLQVFGGRRIELGEISVTVTYIVDGVETTSTYASGYELTLDSTYSTVGKYIKSWTIGNKEYASGTVFTLSGDITARANVADMYKITYRRGSDVSNKVYVIPGSTFNLPNMTFDGAKVICWAHRGGTYLPNSSIIATGDMTFNAMLNNSIAVSVTVNGENSETIYANYSEQLTLEDLIDMYPDLFSHMALDKFEVNGVAYDGKYLTITESQNINILAHEVAKPVNIVMIIAIAGAALLVLSAVIGVVVVKAKAKKQK